MSASWTRLIDELLARAVADRPERDDAPSTGATGTADALADARLAFDDALAGGSAFAHVVDRLGLDRDDAEVLAALCAVDLDPSRQALVSWLGGGDAPHRCSLGVLSTLFGPDHRGPLAVGSDAALVRAGLVEVDDGPTWWTTTVGPARRLAWFLLGDDSLDPDLPVDLDVVAIEAEEAGTGDAIDGRIVVVVSPDRTRQLQAAAAALPSRAVLVVGPTPPSRREWTALVREATLSNVGLIVRVEESLPPETRWWCERTPHLDWAIVSSAELPLEQLPRRAWRSVEAADPHATPEEVDVVLGDDERLADRRLTANQLELVAGASDAVGGPAAALRRLAAGPIERVARRIRPRVTWDDLVLADDQVAQLREFTDRYRHRNIVYGEWNASEFPSPGVIGLFAGPSGTGKTTAAEVIAADLGVDLFKVEISSVVSKYIGETEKNLERMFAAAESGDLVLCLDEADALLGKRSEVSDARDRYANLEVSYLLQRLETYEGLVVMTTNLQTSLDDAFVRRLHAVVSFPTPEAPERRRIWERALLGVPTKDLDLDAIAEHFVLVGGSIRSAAMNAAFLAAAAGTPVTTDVLVRGLKREYQKQGRLITESLFGQWYDRIG